MTQAWPTADLGPLQRLRVLASAVHAPMCVDDYIDEPFDKVWAVMGNLESELPRLLRMMRSFEYRSVDGENISAHATGILGNRADFEVILRSGWCIMQSRFVIGGMVAVPDGAGTRFAVLGGTKVPGARAVRWLLRPLGKALGRSMIRRVRKHVAAAV